MFTDGYEGGNMQVKPRALVGVRVSVYREDDDGVSPEEQRISCEEYAGRQGWDIVDIFEDLDVSASVAPEKRPGLGPWITKRFNEWDILVATKSDRLFRSTFDAVLFFKWLEENKKAMVLVQFNLMLDFRAEADHIVRATSKMMVLMLTMFAEMELDSIKDRFRKTHAYLRTTKRWPGGKAPYGYRVVDHPEGGRMLEVDPETSEIVRDMARMILEGKSQWEVADILTAREVTAPRKADKPGSNFSSAWNGVTIGYILRSPTCMGLRMTKTKSVDSSRRSIVTGSDDLPIEMAEAIFSDAEWAELQEVLAKRSVRGERSKNAAPLLGIAYCMSCGHRVYRTKDGNGAAERYRCPRTRDHQPCPGHTWRADYLQAILDDQMARRLKKEPVMKKEFVQGSDHTRELEKVKKAIANLEEESDLGLIDDDDRADYLARMKRLKERKRKLQELPQNPDRWEWKPTGETYAALYARSDAEARRQILMEAGIRLNCKIGHVELYVPNELSDRLATLTMVA